MKGKSFLLTVLSLMGIMAATVGYSHSVDSAVNQTVNVDMINAQGQSVGQAILTQLEQGVSIKANLRNIPTGWHGFHIHAIGQCTPPDFKSAGDHFNPSHKYHGFKAHQGPHRGDLPNIYVGDNGELNTELVTDKVTLNKGPRALLDKDGFSLVLHAKPDDYTTQPSGDSGGRIVCGAATATSAKK
jgi:superoxide dismutase, Cu-Zn family